jgi:epoxyqueuosine reductase
LNEILAIRDDVEFSERFAGSPVRRAKRHGLLRNAAVVAGNSGDHELVPVLVEALADTHPLVRGHAVWALGMLGAADHAREVLRSEEDAFVCSELDELTPL